jgi:lysophospholipase L1-like esterase
VEKTKLRGAGRTAELKRLAVSFIIFVAVLKLADMAIGRFRPPQQEIPYRAIVLREHPPNLKLHVVRDAAYAKTKDGFTPRTTTLRTDEDGFIIGPKQNQGDVGIAFVGGSTTECADVGEDQRFPYLVSQQVAWRANGALVKTLNSGISASHTLHGSFLILAKILKYRPRAVVLMEGINDLALLSNTGSYWRAPPSRQIVSEDRDLASPRPLHALLVALKNLAFPNLWQLAHPPGAGGGGDEFIGYREAPPPRIQILEDYRSAVETDVALARAWHVEPVLMTQFNRMEVGDRFIRALYERDNGLHRSGFSWPDYVALYKDMNNIVRDVAARQKVLLIDLDRAVPKTRDYIIDPVHLTDRGSRLVAARVTEALSERFPEFMQVQVK